MDSLFFKELNSIIVRNVAYDFAYEFDIVRIFAVFEDIAEEVAQNSSEILVAGIGQKASAVREHTHEIRNERHVRKRVELAEYSVLLVVEPPSRAELNFARGQTVLKTIHKCGYNFVIARI